MSHPNTYRNVFERFVPAGAVDYCHQLWNHLGFEFQIKKSRQTKFGDFRYLPDQKKYIITINNDLNPFAFLVTYLHEVAHLVTYREHGRKADPHGAEWKHAFRKVSAPVMNETVFPEPVLIALTGYFKNPKASSCSDPTLYNVLRRFDAPDDLLPLSKLAVGSLFQFNDRIYRKLEKRRTRSVCEETTSKRKYLIAEIARVKLISG